MSLVLPIIPCNDIRIFDMFGPLMSTHRLLICINSCMQLHPRLDRSKQGISIPGSRSKPGLFLNPGIRWFQSGDRQSHTFLCVMITVSNSILATATQIVGPNSISLTVAGSLISSSIICLEVIIRWTPCVFCEFFTYAIAALINNC
jgi:hypothetical protein